MKCRLFFSSFPETSRIAVAHVVNWASCKYEICAMPLLISGRLLSVLCLWAHFVLYCMVMVVHFPLDVGVVLTIR